MASDEPLAARALLQAMHELRRRGTDHVLEQLEQLDQAEPELSEYLLESLSLIHRELLALGGPARASEQLHRQNPAAAADRDHRCTLDHRIFLPESWAGAQHEPPHTTEPPGEAAAGRSEGGGGVTTISNGS